VSEPLPRLRIVGRPRKIGLPFQRNVPAAPVKLALGELLEEPVRDAFAGRQYFHESANESYGCAVPFLREAVREPGAREMNK
jgi:hypothetical protein